LNDAIRVLFKRSEIALAKHSNNSHFSHLYVKLIYIYIYSKKSLTDTNWFLLVSYFWQRKNIPKKLASIIEIIVIYYLL